jgi:TolB protein
LWQPVYDERPAYLDGFIAEQMYLAYLELADEAIKAGERERAQDLLMAASTLDVADKTDSLLRLESLSVLLTPSPTPTPTMTPTPTATPIVIGTPEPTPIPPSIDRFKGWIAFLSDRDGGQGLYVMRPDGSGQRRANDNDISKLAKMREQERRSPDNTTRVFAMKVDGNDAVNLYKFRDDLPANWEQQFRLTDWNGKSYDPVWAPDNQSIAFVSNSIRNDEIWRIGTDGSDPVRLTQNDWEWDKHPSWSSDSSQIVFYSNRTGVLQIWTMAPDGSGQRNISGNEFNDWDPIWIK